MTRAQLLIFPLLLLSCVSLVTAQSYQPKTIQFKGAGEYADADLLTAAGLKKGMSLTPAEMNDHSKQLMDSGVFENITYTYNGQDLVFTIVPSTTLCQVYLENLPIEKGKALDDRLHQKLPLYRGKVPLDGTLLDDVRKALEAELATKNIQATITSTPLQDPRSNAYSAVSFAITSPAVQIGEVQLTGASAEMAVKARTVIGKSIGSPYSADGSPLQLETNLGNLYHELGYLQAAAHATAQPTPVVDSGAIHIPFVITLDEGPQYKLTAIQLASDMVVTQADFDKQSDLHVGNVVLPEKLRAEWQYLTRQYHNKGLMKVRIVSTATYDRAQGTVRYAITAEPGQVYTMGKLQVSNVSDDLRAAINSAWSVPAGATFNEGAIISLSADPSLARVFSNAELRYSLKLNDDVHTVDVTLGFEKKH